MDVKSYMEIKKDIRTLAGHLAELCGEKVANDLDDDYLVTLLRMRLDVLEKVEGLEKPEDKVEGVIMCLLSICAMAKSHYGINIS